MTFFFFFFSLSLSETHQLYEGDFGVDDEQKYQVTAILPFKKLALKMSNEQV